MMNYVYEKHDKPRAWDPILILTQAFDSIAGNTVVPYRSLKMFFYYHKLLNFAIYNPFCQIVIKSDFK